MSPVKACQDCKWCGSMTIADMARSFFTGDRRRWCLHEDATFTSLETSDWYCGQLHIRHLSIRTMRTASGCGKDAKLFEEIGT